MKILKAKEMTEVDRLSTEVFSVPSILLMENAGRSVAEEILKARPNLQGKRVYIFCGKGNNGGDGLVVARHLAMRGIQPEIFLHFDPSQYAGDALTNWEITRAMGLPVRITASKAEREGLFRSLPRPDLIVDALFGTGLSKPIGPDLHNIIAWINNCADTAFVVSVDIPSGLFADSPEIPGDAVRAHLTITFTALKVAQVVPPASDLAGKVIVVPIGSPRQLLENPGYLIELVDAGMARGALRPRPRAAHKGDFGHVFVVAGSRGKSGAALMAGLSALRTGAGLVTLCLPESLQSKLSGQVPELMSEWLPETPEGSLDSTGLSRLMDVLKPADSVVVGPGLTTNPGTQQTVVELVQNATVPVVLDADGLNAFAGRPEALRNHHGQPMAITPHPGEMARLLGLSIGEIQSDRLGTAREFAREHGCHVVLKGFQTVTADPRGRVIINSSGNPGMATGGTGDILAGMIGCFTAGWACSREDENKLVQHLAAAVYLHGLSGDLAVQDMGMECLAATDLLRFLPAAFKRISTE